MRGKQEFSTLLSLAQRARNFSVETEVRFVVKTTFGLLRKIWYVLGKFLTHQQKSFSQLHGWKFLNEEVKEIYPKEIYSEKLVLYLNILRTKISKNFSIRATKLNFPNHRSKIFSFERFVLYFQTFFSSPDHRETRPTSIEIFLAHFTSLPVDKRPSFTSDVKYWAEKLFVWITQKLKKFARKSEDENLFYFSRLKLDRNLRDSDKLSAEFRLIKQNDEDPNNAAVVRWKPSDIIAAKWNQIDRHSANSQH